MMFSFKPSDKVIVTKETAISSDGHKVPLLILSPKEKRSNVPGVLWLHGGGYMLGMKEMIYMTRGVDAVESFGAVVVSVGYRLSVQKPYPAAIDDCYAALLWLKNNADKLGVRDDQLMVGGESAGGGLCAALCIMARDKNEVAVSYQMPLYPMIDNFDTDSSRNNHGRGWNTWENHIAWKLYLRSSVKENVSPYAAAARETDYSLLPPAYTFVGDGEPFYCETLTFIDNLKRAGVEAECDVYHTDMHGFDMLNSKTDIVKLAKERFAAHFQYAMEHYTAPQKEFT